MPFWLPLRKKNKTGFFPEEGGGFELPPDTVWKLHTLAEGIHLAPPPPAFAAPGVYTGKDPVSPEPLKKKGVLLLPKLEFSTFKYLLFVVANELTASVETTKEKGEVIFPFLSAFDKEKLQYSTHVDCGLFTSKNITLSPSLQRKRYPWRFINHYS